MSMKEHEAAAGQQIVCGKCGEPVPLDEITADLLEAAKCAVSAMQGDHQGWNLVAQRAAYELLQAAIAKATTPPAEIEP